MMRTARLKHPLDRHLKDSAGKAVLLNARTEYAIKREFTGKDGKKMTELMISRGRTVSLLSRFLRTTPFSAN